MITPQIVLRISKSLPKPLAVSRGFVRIIPSIPFTSAKETLFFPLALHHPLPTSLPSLPRLSESEHYTASAGVIPATFSLGPLPSAPVGVRASGDEQQLGNQGRRERDINKDGLPLHVGGAVLDAARARSVRK